MQHLNWKTDFGQTELNRITLNTVTLYGKQSRRNCQSYLYMYLQDENLFQRRCNPYTKVVKMNYFSINSPYTITAIDGTYNQTFSFPSLTWCQNDVGCATQTRKHNMNILLLLWRRKYKCSSSLLTSKRISFILNQL